MSVSAGFVAYLQALRADRRQMVANTEAALAELQRQLTEAQTQVGDLDEILDLFGPDEDDSAPPLPDEPLPEEELVEEEVVEETVEEVVVDEPEPVQEPETPAEPEQAPEAEPSSEPAAEAVNSDEPQSDQR